MTTPDYLSYLVIPAAFHLLPKEMGTRHAIAFLLAIALQESKCCHRRQIRGPARGFFQFEKGGGVKGVLSHPSSRPHAEAVMRALAYPDTAVETAYAAIEHNDVLAAAFARLLLWTDPAPLPAQDDPSTAWQVYLRTWRPGRPHPETWADHYRTAWTQVVEA